MNAIELRSKASDLKAQRELYLQRQTFNELSGPVATTLPISLAEPPSEYNRATKRLTQENLALAHQTNETINQLNSVIAGQSAEIAQIKQVMIRLAQSSMSVEDSVSSITDGIDTIKQQTKKQVKFFDTLTKELNKYWREVIEDTIFFNHDATAVTAGRGLRSILSFGSAAPEAIHAAKRECFAHLKSVRAVRDRIEATYEYAVTYYPSETSEWMKSQTSTLTAGKSSWTILDACKNTFIPELQTALYKMRALPV